MRRQRGVGHLTRDPHRLVQAEVVGEVVERLAVLVARRAADQVEAGLGVVEAAVRPERLDQLVLRLGRHDAPDEEDVGAALGLASGQLGPDAWVGCFGDPAVVGQGGVTAVRRHPAWRSACSLKPLRASPSMASGARSSRSVAACLARVTLPGSQPAKSSGLVKLWKSRIRGSPCSARYGATADDVVNW